MTKQSVMDKNRLNHLLQKLIEECSEVQKEACKTIIFGTDGSYDTLEINKNRLEREVQDLYAALIMLHEEFEFDFTPHETKIKNKITKVNKYYEYSQNPWDPNKKHDSHETRGSDSSLYDEVCIHCGAKDINGWGDLARPCPKKR